MRFPEFSDEWEKTTLGNISNIKIYQPQTIKPLNFGKYKVFGANGYIGYYEEYNHNTNQVTISCRGEKSGTVNFVEPFVWITGNSMVLNLDKTSEIIKKFLYYELIINNVNYLITGSGQPQLTRDNLVQHKIYFPNIDEQTKIADFLSLIDKRIELQNKIIKDYELLKKIINIRMFTHSAKLPILRFPEFNEVWEKTTLGNISNIKIYQPQTIKPLNFGKYKVFGANGYIGYYEEYNHNTNQVTISCRGEKSGTVNFVEPFVWITGNSMVLNLDKTSEIIKKFLYYELISNNVNYLITGSGQPQLTRDSLIQHKIYFPNIDEQLKIANFLSKLDEILLNVKCEKERLIKNKTFLLQNLFI